MQFRPSRGRKVGFTLLESVLATFLLVTAVLLAVYVFNSGLQFEVGNEKRVDAALVAESALAEVRQAAKQNYSVMKTTYRNRTWNLPEYRDFTITSVLTDVQLSSSCDELESQYPATASLPAPARKTLGDSAVDALVRISWFGPSLQSVEVSERIVSFRETTQFRVEIVDNLGNMINAKQTLSKDQAFQVSVQAEADSQEVKDLQYTWSVEAIDGFGSVAAVSRDGLNCRYVNSYQTFSNQTQYALGHCYLCVTSVYQGRIAKDRIEIENVP
jgi:Tfp pilus assembly protein PilV